MAIEGGRVGLYVTSSGKRERFLTERHPGGEASDPSVTADGKSVVYVQGEGTCAASIRSVALTGGPPSILKERVPGRVPSEPVQSATGMLAYARTTCTGKDDFYTAESVLVVGAKEIPFKERKGTRIHDLDWSGDARRIAVRAMFGCPGSPNAEGVDTCPYDVRIHVVSPATAKQVDDTAAWKGPPDPKGEVCDWGGLAFLSSNRLVAGQACGDPHGEHSGVGRLVELDGTSGRVLAGRLDIIATVDVDGTGRHHLLGVFSCGETCEDAPSYVQSVRPDGPVSKVAVGLTQPAWVSAAQSAESGIHVSDVTYISARRGWALAAGRLLATEDAGATWSDSPPPPSGVQQVRFANAQVGYSWEDAGPLWATADGGRTWRPGGLDQVRQLETAQGVVWAIAGEVPYPGVWRAQVGEPEFRKLGITPNRSASLDVHAGTAYVLGVSGAGPVEASLDVWSAADSVRRSRPIPCRDEVVPSAGLGVSSTGDVILVCETGSEPTQITAHASADEARSWTALPAPPEVIQDVAALPGRIFAWGRDVHVYSHGRWTLSLAGPASGKGFALVGFQDSSHGVALTREGVLHRTEDAGKTWTTVDFPL